MKDTEFVVNAFRKGMSDGEMNELAHGLNAQYTEGYAHHEGFDAGDLAIVVMKRDVDESQSQPSGIEQAAETLNRALQQSNQTIEYLRNEGAVLRQQLADMITVEDAKTLANVAYNRAKNLPCEDCTQQDFEDWWTEYRKENGFVNQQPERKSKLTSYDVFEQLYELAKEHLTWHDLEAFVTTKDSDFNKFWTRMQKIYGDGCVSAQCVGVINDRTKQGCRRLEYLKLITDEIVANQGKGQSEPNEKSEPYPINAYPETDFPAFTAGYFFNQLREPLRSQAMSQAKNMRSEAESLVWALDTRPFLDWDKTTEGRTFWEQATAYLKTGVIDIGSMGSHVARQCKPDNYVFPCEPKPKADPTTADEVLPRIKALAAKFFPWDQGLLHLPIEGKHKSVQLFNVLVADEYELELNIEATNKGLQLFCITRLQYLEKVAQAVADAMNAQP